MSLKLSTYPQCCKAMVIHGFGAGHVSEHGDGYKSVRSSEEQVTDFLNKNIKSLQAQGIQTVFACPTNHQPEAIAALEAFGFIGPTKKALKEVERTQSAAIRSSSGNVERYETIVHQMHPMFYLIPPYKG